jgi:galactokinase
VYIPQSTRDLMARMKSDMDCVISRDPAVHGREVVLARAPGRLDVMGGISDYSGGLVCEMPLDCSTAVGVQRRDDRTVVIESYNAPTATGDNGTSRVRFSLDDLYGTAALLPVEMIRAFFSGEKHWAAHVAGAYWVLGKHRKLTRRTSGANIVCHSNVPLRGGVASSAALEVAALSAITTAYHLILEPLETAVLAQAVENLIVGRPSGVMDQVTSMMGSKGRLLLLECQPHTVKGFVDVPAGLMVCGMDSGARSAEGWNKYRDTRIAAFMAQVMIARAYEELGMKGDPTKGYLANVTPAVYRKYFRKVLPRMINGGAFLQAFEATGDRMTAVDPAASYAVRGAADHHVLENARV